MQVSRWEGFPAMVGWADMVGEGFPPVVRQADVAVRGIPGCGDGNMGLVHIYADQEGRGVSPHATGSLISSLLFSPEP